MLIITEQREERATQSGVWRVGSTRLSMSKEAWGQNCRMSGVGQEDVAEGKETQPSSSGFPEGVWLTKVLDSS